MTDISPTFDEHRRPYTNISTGVYKFSNDDIILQLKKNSYNQRCMFYILFYSNI